MKVLIPVEIATDDCWVKIVEMLQQNWALIEPDKDGDQCVVFFVHDRSGVFDRKEFDSIGAAERSLRRNGFKRFTDDPKFREFLTPPQPPFFQDDHPNGAIYSSGRFWRQ